MDQKFQIVSDSSCDLPTELVTEKKIEVVPFYVSMDDRESMKEGVDISVRDFYEMMVQNPKKFPKSSMPSVQDYADVFERCAKQGMPVICICITSKFSASYQSATIARGMVAETYPQAQIHVIDSAVDTVLQGIYVLEAVSMREAGYTAEQAVKELAVIQGSGRIFFTVGNLRYLQHGGRIGKLTGMAGALLDIKPLITLKDGEIFPSGICRGREKSKVLCRKLLLQYVKEIGCGSKDLSICIGYGYDREEAEAFQRDSIAFMKENGYAVTKEDLPLYQIGATIGVHTGPYPLGFGVIRRHR
ncbi:MAG: DegV family protein [Lachnospiraceae bacterium]|nr:DegV family protein [Lachnospiraceae bacterium]